MVHDAFCGRLAYEYSLMWCSGDFLNGWVQDCIEKGARNTEFRFRYSFPDTIQQYHTRALSSDVSVGEILRWRNMAFQGFASMIWSIIHSGSHINLVC